MLILYDQITLNLKDRHNKLQQILSPNVEDDGVLIYQDFIGKHLIPILKN
jgi:hypothetical protein